MQNLDWGLELVLVGLLAIVLVHAIRLERALRAMRNDRLSLGDAIAGFDDSARQAEAGISRLHSVSAETAQALAQRLEQGASLKDDLAFLIERSESLADRLDGLVRSARPLAQQAQAYSQAQGERPAPIAAANPKQALQMPAAPKVRSQAERDLLVALQGAS